MKILAIETSGKVCAVALAENDKLIMEKIIEDENTHSVKLMPLINEVFKENNMYLSDVDLFSCDIGPGSFTGIRIGVSTVKAFLDAKNKKAVGVTSLEVLARNIQEDGIICSLIDAKNDNVYYGLFEKIGKEYKQLEELRFDNINNILKTFNNKDKKIFFVGNGSIVHKDVIESELKNALITENTKINSLNARNIALVAFEKNGQAVDSNNLSPIYLRKSNAER